MSDDFIERTMRMKKWAVVGASDDPTRYSHKIMKILRERGYEVYPISPKYDEIDGLKCYADLSDLPEKPDVVDMVVNPKIGRGVMEEVRGQGIAHVWLQPGAESEEIRRFARENGIGFVENCIMAQLQNRPGFHPDKS